MTAVALRCCTAESANPEALRSRVVATSSSWNWQGISGASRQTGARRPCFSAACPMPSGIAVASNGDLIVTEDIAQGKLSRVTADGSTSSVIATDIKSEDVEIDTAGNIIVFQESTGQLLSVTPTGTISVLFDGLSAPVALAIEATGDYVVAEHGGTVWRIASDGGGASVILSGLGSLEGLALTPDGDLLIAGSAGRLTRIAPDGSSSTTFFTGLGSLDHLVVRTSL